MSSSRCNTVVVVVAAATARANSSGSIALWSSESTRNSGKNRSPDKFGCYYKVNTDRSANSVDTCILPIKKLRPPAKFSWLLVDMAFTSVYIRTIKRIIRIRIGLYSYPYPKFSNSDIDNIRFCIEHNTDISDGYQIFLDFFDSRTLFKIISKQFFFVQTK